MAVTMRINKEHDGIELLFPDSERPGLATRTALKEQGFRWHNQGKYWFARQTPERLIFAEKLTGAVQKDTPAQSVPEKESKNPQNVQKKGRASAIGKPENTFAAVYSSIGGIEIRNISDLDLFNIPSSGVYCKDTNAFFRHTWGSNDCISVWDLTNAGKNGKTCTSWGLYPLDSDGIICNSLYEDEKLQTCKDLIQALRDEKPLESVKVSTREEKGIEVFSPFVEMKPLAKLPEEWNKRNFTAAVLSGQIYMGKVDYRYTDDYALDAAYDYGKGVDVNMPLFARDVVEGWSSGTSLCPSSIDTDKSTCCIGFSEYSNSSKTLYFDLNCDIREGKRRADERAAGIQAYNSMMKASCIQVPAENISENKIYSVTSLDMSANTGIYGSKTEFMQGNALAAALSGDGRFLEILSVNELEVIPDRLYEVSSFYHPRTFSEPDDRIIDCGNKLQLVTGKALLELTEEGVGLPYIKEATGEYSTIESAQDNLKQFVRGEKQFMFTGLKHDGYQASLDKLTREADRAGHGQHSRGRVDDLIAAAQKQALVQNGYSSEKNIVMSR